MISDAVQNQLFQATMESTERQAIRIPLGRVGGKIRTSAPNAIGLRPSRNRCSWSVDEHERFLEGLELFPSGPWRFIAAYVGTKTPRQVMTHAQKYREKILRHVRGLRTRSGKIIHTHSRRDWEDAKPRPDTVQIVCGKMQSNCGLPAPCTTITDENICMPQVSPSIHYEFMDGYACDSPLWDDFELRWLFG